jgi:hypothetical protein
MGLGSSLPPAELASAGFSRFRGTAVAFQARKLGFKNSRIGGEYDKWKNEEEGVFTLITVRPTWLMTRQPTQRLDLYFLALTA